ncbi:hypothetical protein B0H11DRAFT_2352527 [Mycena galericulata]|nr:hypothetical protein B0H11DRAFT_2352527 [Mycena galericulata]
MARPPSTGSSEGDVFGDSYVIDLLMMADFGDGYSTSIFSSAPPSSIPEDDDWSSRWSSSGSRPVSAAPSSDYGDPTRHPYLLKSDSGMAQIGPLLTCRVFLTHVLNLADTVNFSCVEADLHLADEATDMVARLGWDFKPSNDRWLDPDVSSEVAEFPQGIRLTGKNKIYAFHRVTGCPSQFPIFRQRTGYLINLTDMKDMNPDPDVTVDQLIRDQDSHSWGRGTGARSKVDAYVPGSFFGLSGDVKIACRRAAPECGGVTACESLDPVFLKGEWRELNPEEIRILAAATLRTRQMQDNTEVGRTLASRRHASCFSSAMPSISSNKRRKKLEDPLEGWVMQDPDTGEELTGKEWVERY